MLDWYDLRWFAKLALIFRVFDHLSKPCVAGTGTLYTLIQTTLHSRILLSAKHRLGSMPAMAWYGIQRRWLRQFFVFFTLTSTLRLYFIRLVISSLIENVDAAPLIYAKLFEDHSLRFPVMNSALFRTTFGITGCTYTFGTKSYFGRQFQNAG